MLARRLSGQNKSDVDLRKAFQQKLPRSRCGGRRKGTEEDPFLFQPEHLRRDVDGEYVHIKTCRKRHEVP